MRDLHRLLAVGIVLVSLGGTLWSIWAVYRGRDPRRLPLLGAVMAAAVALEAVAGLVLLLTGQRPPQPVHELVGALCLLPLPAALLAGRARSPRTARWLAMAGWIALLLLALRAAGSGSSVQ